MPLTRTAVRNAKTAGRPFRLYDERGLYLEVRPRGGKWWRLKYRFDSKEKLLALGTYPDVTLKQARDRRDEARRLIADGIDPSAKRRRAKAERQTLAASSFEAVAREWHRRHAPGWAPSHSKRILRRFERDLFPYLRQRPIADVTAPELLDVLRRIESRGALDTAHRALQNAGQVFRYAVATGRAERDPSHDLRGALPPSRGGHFAAITDPNRLGELLRMLDGYQGTPTVRAALRLAPLLFVRPGELRAMRWADVDLDASEWRFIVPKTRQPHLVPLADQAVVILKELQSLTGRGEYVFPSARGRGRPMSENAITAGLRRLEVPKEEASGHGFRATARTILAEVLGFAPEVIEHQLAHRVPDRLGAAYNRTKFLAERRRMMQAWADYLEVLRSGEEKVMPLRGRSV